MPSLTSSTLSLFLIFHYLTLASSSRPIDIVSSKSLPPPWQDPDSICHPRAGPLPNSLLCDPSGLLAAQQVSQLDTTLNQILSGIKPYSLINCDTTPFASETGFRVALVLVRSMKSDGNPLPQRAEAFAKDLYARWHLTDNCDASVLFFLAYEDKRMYILSGAFSKAYLGESEIQDVYSKMLPLLVQFRLTKALSEGVTSIASYLSKFKGASRNAPVDNNDDPAPQSGMSSPVFLKHGPEWWDLELSVIAIIFTALSIFACCNGVGGTDATILKREKKSVRYSLDVIKAEYAGALLAQYIPATCPICGEDLTPAWVPTVPSLASDGLESIDVQQGSAQTRPVRTLRCRHAFHESCFDREHPTPSDTIPHCPICGDRGGGSSTPPPIAASRSNDVAFRVRYLAKRFPHILTADVTCVLLERTPDAWPDRMTDAYLNNVKCGGGRAGAGDDGGDSGGGRFGWVGPMLAGTGLGFLFSGLFSGWGDDERSQYSSIPDGGGGSGWGVGNGSLGSGAGWGGNVLGGSGGQTGSGIGWGGGGGIGSGMGWGGGGGSGMGWGGGGGNGTGSGTGW